MERIAILIGRCTIYEQLYLNTNDIPDIVEKATEDLRTALLALYTAILHVLGHLVKVFKSKDACHTVGWMDTNKSLEETNLLKPWEATLAELQAIEKPESVVNLAASDLDKCCKNKPEPRPWNQYW